MMKKKSNSGLIKASTLAIVLVTFAAVGIGYSAWNITQNNKASVELKPSVADITDKTKDPYTLEKLGFSVVNNSSIGFNVAQFGGTNGTNYEVIGNPSVKLSATMDKTKVKNIEFDDNFYLKAEFKFNNATWKNTINVMDSCTVYTSNLIGNTVDLIKSTKTINHGASFFLPFKTTSDFSLYHLVNTDSSINEVPLTFEFFLDSSTVSAKELVDVTYSVTFSLSYSLE